MIVYLGVDTVWRLIGGWIQLMEEVDRATTFEELRAAGDRYGRVMGENAARAFVLLATVAIGNTAAGFSAKVPKLPGAQQMTVMTETGKRFLLPELVEVETVTMSAEGATLTLVPGAIAMTAQGMGDLPKRTHRHHIATNKNTESDARGGPWTPRFQKIFDKAKMSLDDEANIAEIEGHQGPHPEEYHQRVFRRLNDATMTCRSASQCQEMLKKELQRLAKEIATPGTLLNRLITEGG